MLIGEDIAVLGAGIAGLAVATALAQRGARVTVYERASEISEVGAGLQISPNGRVVLEALGIDLADIAQRSSGVRLKDGYTGRSVTHLDFLTARPDAPFVMLHRADLIAALLRGAEAVGVRVVLDHEVREIDDQADAVCLSFTAGQAARHSLVLGADGLHSRMRSTLNGDKEPFFTGQVAWRATVASAAPHPDEAQVHLAQGQHVVTYPLRGGALTNIVAVQETQDWREEGWHLSGDPEDLRFQFDQFGPEITALFARVTEVSRWGLFRHEVAEVWGQGRCALLGDAAHPTLPFLAQGANLALEDAWVLADCLSQMPFEDAFAAYHIKRQARVVRAISAANANARNYHLGGIKRWGAHIVLRLLDRLAPNAMMRRFGWLYDFDVTQ